MKNLLKAIGYCIFYIVFQMAVMSLAASVLAMSGGGKTEADVMNAVYDNMLLLTIVSNLLSVAVLALFFRLRKKNFAREINLRKTGGKAYVLPCLAAFSYSMAFSALTYSMTFNNAEQVAQSVNHFSDKIPWLGIAIQIAAMIVVAPVAEEIIFRGLVLTRLQRRFTNVISVAVSGVLFGLIHAAAGGLVLIVGAAAMGIIFGIICVRTKSLLPAVAAHGAANLPDFIYAGLPELSKGVQYAMIAGWLVIFGILMAAFVKKKAPG